MKLTFRTKEVLRYLRVNRETHALIVREAQAGFRGKWGKILDRAKEQLDSGGPIETSLHLTVPDNHLDDFDRAIAMLEMTTDEEIELDEASFQAYVRNEWKWRRQFLVSNSAYSATAADLSGGGI